MSILQIVVSTFPAFYFFSVESGLIYYNIVLMALPANTSSVIYLRNCPKLENSVKKELIKLVKYEGTLVDFNPNTLTMDYIIWNGLYNLEFTTGAPRGSF